MPILYTIEVAKIVKVCHAVCSLVIFDLSQFFKVVGYYLVKHIKIKFYIFTTHSIKQNKHKK